MRTNSPVDTRHMGASRRILAFAACLIALAAPAAARAHVQPLPPGPGEEPVLPVKDRVLPPDAHPPAHAARARIYHAPDGTPITMEVSRLYGGDTPANRAAAQTYADFLGSRVHGDELSKLRVYIGTPDEVTADCGGEFGVVACYAPAERRMYVPGEDVKANGPFTRGYVVTHEYGHHIANYRSNYPFPASDYGPKFWASYWHVCAGSVGRHPIFYPGDEGKHYLANPGEGFADTYAHLAPEHYPDAPWQFSPRFKPDDGAFAALRRDVLHPWDGQETRTVSGSLDSDQSGVGVSLPVSLDGLLGLSLSGPKGADFDLEIRNGDAVLERSHRRGSSDRLRAEICRRQSADTADLSVRVVRVSGSGAFTLRIRYPG